MPAPNATRTNRVTTCVITFVIVTAASIAIFALWSVFNPRSPTPAAGEERMIGGAPMVFVPAGEFLMGMTDEQFQDAMEQLRAFCHPCPPFQNVAKQPHTVDLDAFWIDKFQVTNSLYTKCVEAGKCAPPNSTGSHTRASYYGNAQFDNYPVLYVSWQDAKTFCEWSGKRLPTEAEYEKAARGTDGRSFPWGNEFDQSRLNSDHVVGDTTPVGNYPGGASPYGALDMAGNVWVWMADWFGEDYYAGSPRDNPQGPASGEYRVQRGGAWGSLMIQMRGAFRFAGDPEQREDYIGIRCAASSA